MQQRLEELVRRFGADTGTLHWLEGDVLVLKGQVGIPPHVVEIVQRVPVGQGNGGAGGRAQRPGGGLQRPDRCERRRAARAQETPASTARSSFRCATPADMSAGRSASAFTGCTSTRRRRRRDCSRKLRGWGRPGIRAPPLTLPLSPRRGRGNPLVSACGAHRPEGEAEERPEKERDPLGAREAAGDRREATFIAITAAETTAPAQAIAPPKSNEGRPARRARARSERQVESQPTPTASEPTSVTGTSSASPRNAAAAESRAIRRTAFAGVPCTRCTRASDGWTRPRLPMPKSSRVAATKLPLKILISERKRRKENHSARSPARRTPARRPPPCPGAPRRASSTERRRTTARMIVT